MAERKVVDWERVEVEYRAAVLSLAELATAHGISKGRICQVAKAQGWVRDLRAKILAKAEDKLNRAGLTEDLNAKRATETEVVEQRSDDVVAVRLSHRTDIKRTKRIANKLLEQLEFLSLPSALPEKATLEQLQVHRALVAETLKAHAAVLKQLADTQRVVVTLEREAFGIAQIVEENDGAPIDRIVGARRLAFALQRAGALMSQMEAPHA